MTSEERNALVAAVRQRYHYFAPYLTEQTRRLWAASEALTIGRHGTAIVVEAIGIAADTLRKGKSALQDGARPPLPDQQRSPGGGRKKLIDTDATLLADLDRLIDPATRGDPESPLRWTCKSTYQLAEVLQTQGHDVSQRTVYRLLVALGYSLQSNRKTEEGTDHPDRDAQFHFIYRRVKQFQKHGQPVISVDTKKKENIGNFARAGQEWEPKGGPRRVDVHDFRPKGGYKVCPYGIYDPTQDEGWVNVGISHDTAQFAVASIRGWWQQMGRQRYPQATKLLITADAGGSNGYRTRLWKVELQGLADDLEMAISVCHFPPGTSKWNKIEHRLFGYISKNWRGRPLDNLATVVNLIASTTTKTGLYVEAVLDQGSYVKGIKVSEEEMERLRLKRDSFHGEWNYTLLPRN